MNQIKTIGLFGALTALLMAVGWVMAPSQWVLFGILAFTLNLGAYFFSDRLVLRMHGGRELSESEEPKLHSMVSELAQAAGIPKPRLYMIADPQPNAFATGRNPANGAVAITEGLMQLLSERELRGVIAHEIAHIKNRDILIATLAAAVAGLISHFANAIAFGGFLGSSDEEEHSSPVQSLLMILVAPLSALLIQMGISRAREFVADKVGAEICNDPGALAMALQRLEQSAQIIPSGVNPAAASLFIVNPFSGGTQLMKWLSTHPPTEERVVKLLAMISSTSGSSIPFNARFKNNDVFSVC